MPELELTAGVIEYEDTGGDGPVLVMLGGLVIGFGSSTALASAYGIAVTGTFVTTTLLFFAIVRMSLLDPVPA